MDKQKEMNKFLERYNLSSLNQEEIENINKSITSTETGLKRLTSKGPGPDGFTGESYQTRRGELTPTFLKLLLKIAEEGTLPNSFL